MPPPAEEDDIGSQGQLAHYEPDDHELEAHENSRDTNHSSEHSSKPATVHIPFLDRLRALPEVRPIPWRPGQELPPERSLDSPRVQQRGAILLSTRGKVMDQPCEHCAAGYGRFSVCVTLENWFQGGCSSCIFTSKGNKCSLRFQTSGIADGRALRYHTDNPEVLQKYIRSAAENPKPPKKRKRRSAPPQSQSAAGFSSPYPQLESPPPVSPDLDTLLQAEIAREQSSNQNDFVHQKEKKQQSNIAKARGSLNGFVGIAPSPHPYGSRISIPHQEPVEKIISTSIPQNLSSNDIKPSIPPLIDTLPKIKQRQIYGAISGIQGGIDHLHKQLDSLKTLLGIDMVDSPRQH